MTEPEFKTIKIRVYKTPDNQPTCQTTEGYCMMLRSTRFGTESQCALQAGSRDYLDRYFDETVGEHGEYTYLKPQDCCVIWSNNEQ